MRRPVNTVALITDYGLRDPYVGVVKGVIKSINPHVEIIDVTHNVPKFNILIGALILKKTYRYFPKGTVFVGIIDPTVGSPRRPILIVSKNYYFVGPDNGLLIPASTDDGVELVIHLTNDTFFVKPVSVTFHGRDIFAPVAAYLSLGIDPRAFGQVLSVDELVKIEVKEFYKITEEGMLITKVLLVDDFGNVILPIEFSKFAKLLNVRYGSRVFIKVGCSGSPYEARVSRGFSEVCEGCLAVYEDSYGLAEIGVFMGNASELLGLGIGDKVCIGKV